MQNIISKEPVREFNGKIMGFIETDRDGNQQVRDFYGRILGTFDKKMNVTRDFYGRIVAQGDQSAMMIGYKV